MRVAKALFLGPSAFDVLKLNAGGQVHSVFDRTFNIMIGGVLVGVAQSGVSRSPINLITDIPPIESMPSLGIRKGMQVRRVGDRVLVGGALEILLEGAELWRPKTRVELCHDIDTIQRNLHLVKHFAASRAGREGLGQLLPRIDEIAAGEIPQTSEMNAGAEAVLPHLVNLVKAARSGNLEGVRGAAQKLIGLGPGLSPSADDALSGFAAALWWVSHSLDGGTDRAQRINETIVSCAGGTTLLSQQLLRHAARGETNERVGELLEAILAGTPSSVEAGVERVLQIGETSGIDIMVGLLLGVRVGMGG